MSNKYFAAKDAKDTAAILMGKIDAWTNSLTYNGYLDKVKRSWAKYYGVNFEDNNSGHSISFKGEQGELAQININHFHNIAQNMLNMTTSSRPAMDARSTNTDYKSLVQTYLANGLLDYYLREKRLEVYLKKACEMAIVMGVGYVKLDWNTTAGDLYDYNEDNQPVHPGDLEFSNLSFLDVIFDATKESTNLDWITCRTFKNKFDLAAKFPKFENELINMQSKDAKESHFLSGFGYNDTDDIPVYEFYHKRTEAMPNGRYMLFVSGDVCLVDTAMPYRAIPIYRIAPADIIGTPFGYTPMFDLLSIQDAVDSSYSTILSNHNAFGVQNIYVPRGADINVNSLAGGLNIIEGNAQAGRPEALNLTATPAEIFKFLDMLERAMETISGVNSVARGNPEASLKSGTALALVQAMALQFMSGLQQQYIQLIEDIGTGMINILKDFAAVPRVASIVGKHNRAYMKEFVGEDLSSINRVIVDVGNPLSKSTAGRVQMAEQMLQMGLIKDPQQYFAVINTGKLDVMTEDGMSEILLIRAENEKMMSGEPIKAIAFDSHAMHIKEHKSVLADPELRNDPTLVNAVLSHIQEHLDLLRTLDPFILSVIGDPSMGQPPPPSNVPNSPPPQQAGMVGQSIQPEGDSAQIVGPGIENGANMPNMPLPPAPFNTLPTNAEDALAAQGG